MTFCTSSNVTPNQSCALVAGFIAVLIVCIAIPRALCFLPALYSCGALMFLWYKTGTKPVFDKSLALWLGSILVLSGLSAVWAIDPAFALERTLKTTGLFLSCLGIVVMAGNIPLNAAKKGVLAAGMVLLCALAAIVIFTEYKTEFFITGHFIDIHDSQTRNGITSGFILNRSLVYLVLLCLPALLMLYLSDLSGKTKIFLGSTLAFALLLALVCTKSQTAQIAILVAIIILLYPAHKKFARQVMMAGILALMIAMPFMMKPAYEQYLKTEMVHKPAKLVREASVVHRLEVWNFIATKIWEKPFIGHGTEATRFLKADKPMEHMNATTVLHPHNIFLQIWIEFGMVGIALAGMLLVWLIRKLDDLPKFCQKYYSILLVTVLCVTSIGYGMWQSWQIGMVFSLIGFSAMVVRLYGPRSSD